MTSIQSLISLLSEQEQQGFIVYLHKRNKRTDTKNTVLFKDILKGEPAKLKTKLGSNAYNVLKKRLKDRLIDYTADCILTNEKTTEIEIMKLLILGRKLFDIKAYKSGFRLLSTAEKKAQEVSNYHLLNEIYNTLIEHSYHSLAPNQNELFALYQLNKTAFVNQSNLNMAYAVIRKSFVDHERQLKQVDFKLIIQQTFEKFNISSDLGYNFQSLYQIAEMADIVGAQLKNYYDIDLFFEKQIKNIQNGPLDTENQLIYQIDLLFLIAHIYFRKKEFDKSLHNLNSMHQQMLRYNKKYFTLRQIKHDTLFALNQNYLNNPILAANTLDKTILKFQKSQAQQRDLLQSKLARIMIHFQQNELIIAKQKMSQLRQSDKWYAELIGIEWLLNKKFMEILLHIELGNTDYVDSRINSLLRKQTTLFKGRNNQALPFLKLIAQFHQNPSIVLNKNFGKLLDKTFEWKPIAEEDLFLMSFYAWIKSKMIQKPLYKTTLNLINEVNTIR